MAGGVDVLKKTIEAQQKQIEELKVTVEKLKK